MTRYMKRGGRVYITIFPISPSPRSLPRLAWVLVKGNPEEWVASSDPAASCSRSRVFRGGRSRGSASSPQAPHQDQDCCLRTLSSASKEMAEGLEGSEG